jgi:hypothetical protein
MFYDQIGEASRSLHYRVTREHNRHYITLTPGTVCSYINHMTSRVYFKEKINYLFTESCRPWLLV